MSLFAWIILGLIAGFIGSKIVNKRGEGLVLDLVLGIVGAIAGRMRCSICSEPTLASARLNLSPRLCVAVVPGAIAVLVVYTPRFGARSNP